MTSSGDLLIYLECVLHVWRGGSPHVWELDIEGASISDDLGNCSGQKKRNPQRGFPMSFNYCDSLATLCMGRLMGRVY